MIWGIILGCWYNLWFYMMLLFHTIWTAFWMILVAFCMNLNVQIHMTRNVCMCMSRNVRSSMIRNVKAAGRYASCNQALVVHFQQQGPQVREGCSKVSLQQFAWFSLSSYFSRFSSENGGCDCGSELPSTCAGGQDGRNYTISLKSKAIKIIFKSIRHLRHSKTPNAGQNWATRP